MVSEVRDNAVPPNYRERRLHLHARLGGAGQSRCQRASPISVNINTSTIAVGVGGTISDKNVIKKAVLSIRDGRRRCRR